MDILASMLAYLGCVTGIVGALAISFFVFFVGPDQPPIAQHAMTMASRATAKPSEPKIVSKTGPIEVNAPPSAAAVAMAAPAADAARLRPKTQLGRTQVLRRLVQEERARRLAYQQDPDFDSRFLGYAD
jgi:hypothetical protein